MSTYSRLRSPDAISREGGLPSDAAAGSESHANFEPFQHDFGERCSTFNTNFRESQVRKSSSGHLMRSDAAPNEQPIVLADILNLRSQPDGLDSGQVQPGR